MVSVSKCIAKVVAKKLSENIKEGIGCEASLNFNDPIKFKIEDGAASLHLNADISIDAASLLKLINEIGE